MIVAQLVVHRLIEQVGLIKNLKAGNTVVTLDFVHHFWDELELDRPDFFAIDLYVIAKERIPERSSCFNVRGFFRKVIDYKRWKPQMTRLEVPVTGCVIVKVAKDHTYAMLLRSLGD